MLMHSTKSAIWEQGDWPTQWTESIVIPLPKKGNLRQCNNYRTISLISHPSKVLLHILLNRLRPQVETILSEEQAGFRAGRSTTEQILNIRILGEEYISHQKELHHNFIDFKKAFDRVWHEALWATMKKHNINPRVTATIRSLYNNAVSAVLTNNTLSEQFRTTVGVRQGCLRSPCLFNLFLEQIMMDALEGFEGTVSIGGRKISNLRFADDIDLLAGSRKELRDLTTRLDDVAKAYGMEISTEKSKTMTMGSAPDGSSQGVSMGGEILEEVDKFTYLGATITADGKSDQEIRTRMAKALQALSQLTRINKSNNISTSTKVHLLRSVVFSTFLYGCESWTISASSEKKIEAFEMKCYRRLMRVPYTAHRTNDSIRCEITTAIGAHKHLLQIVRERKLSWYGHVTRSTSSLAQTILQGSVEGKRGRGRPRMTWRDNIKTWTNMTFSQLLENAKDRQKWRDLVSSSSTPPRSIGSRDN